MVIYILLFLWRLLCFEVSIISPEDGNTYFPKRRVALCVVAVQKALSRVRASTYVHESIVEISHDSETNAVFAVSWH